MYDQNNFVQNPTMLLSGTAPALAPEIKSVPTAPDIQSKNRPLEVIEEEISLKMNTLTLNYIDVGGLLNEAKEQLGVEKFKYWVYNRIHIRLREAQRYIQVAEAYKDDPSLVTPLGITKALALLKIPDDKREAFINKSHEVADGHQKTVYDMSVKELNRIIKKEMEPKNNDGTSLDEEPKRKKILSGIKSAQKNLNSILSYLEQYKEPLDDAEKFRSIIRSLSETVNKCEELINSKALSERKIPVIHRGEL